MENRVPFFSKNRWGPGSILVIMILVLLDLLFLLLYFEYQYRTFLALFIIVLLSAIIIIIVKGAENITIVDKHDSDLINDEGVVMMRIEPGKPGVVKIKNEEWSAMSDEIIEENERIIVLRREGLYLFVRKK
ncbi:MAG: NfeD family protein [Thermoplasmata archaeon]